MIFSWLRQNVEAKARTSSFTEINRYISGLQAMTDEDMGIILAVATVIRVNMEDQEYLPKDLYDDTELPPTHVMGQYQMDINKLARDFNRRGQPTDAVGAMLISYSLRCLNVAELREHGRDIWTEIKRGYAHVENTLREGEQKKGEAFPERVWEEWKRIPAGLEPVDHDV